MISRNLIRAERQVLKAQFERGMKELQKLCEHSALEVIFDPDLGEALFCPDCLLTLSEEDADD